MEQHNVQTKKAKNRFKVLAPRIIVPRTSEESGPGPNNLSISHTSVVVYASSPIPLASLQLRRPYNYQQRSYRKLTRLESEKLDQKGDLKYMIPVTNIACIPIDSSANVT